ncbi:hypothetical protein ES703_118238 [subsurface metagenome]
MGIMFLSFNFSTLISSDTFFSPAAIGVYDLPSIFFNLLTAVLKLTVGFCKTTASLPRKIINAILSLFLYPSRCRDKITSVICFIT